MASMWGQGWKMASSKEVRRRQHLVREEEVIFYFHFVIINRNFIFLLIITLTLGLIITLMELINSVRLHF